MKLISLIAVANLIMSILCLYDFYQAKSAGNIPDMIGYGVVSLTCLVIGTGLGIMKGIDNKCGGKS